MEGQLANIETFINKWNGVFPNSPLTAADLKSPYMVMGALFQIFDRLDIDRDAVLAPPPEEERTENTMYYADLIPVINMTRVINHLFSMMPQIDATFSVTHLLQPTTYMSHSILILLFNLMVFKEQWFSDIAPDEDELFARTDQVKALEDEKNKLLEMLNEQAEEKGKLSERLVKLDYEIKQYEEDLKQEKELHDKEKQERDAILKENRQTAIIIEKKRSHLDELNHELERKRAMRVYDADDIKHKAEQAAQNVQEAEEKLNSLRATLMQKENSFKHLQTLKPNLDTANNLNNEIIKLSENLRDFETGDLESESKEGELDVFNTELSELQAQLAELQTARAEAAKIRLDNQVKKQQEKTVAHSALREAEEKDKKLLDQYKKGLQRTEEIKEATLLYEAEKKSGMEQLADIKINFCNELKAVNEALISKAEEAKKKIEDKLQNRRL